MWALNGMTGYAGVGSAESSPINKLINKLNRAAGSPSKLLGNVCLASGRGVEGEKGNEKGSRTLNGREHTLPTYGCLTYLRK